MKESQLEQHASFILEQYAAGSRQTSIRRELKARGVETSQQNLSKWIARRVAAIQARAKMLGQIGTAPGPDLAPPAAGRVTVAPAAAAADTRGFNQDQSSRDQIVPGGGDLNNTASPTASKNSVRGTAKPPQENDKVAALDAKIKQSESSTPTWMTTNGLSIIGKSK